MGRDSADHAPCGVTPFQFTRPHGARLQARRCGHGERCFNSRARMGRDPSRKLSFTTLQVSIHAPAWGATMCRAMRRRCTRFQFTRPHGARPGSCPRQDNVQGVSIHAPAWGATAPGKKSASSSRFQFTRPHGARHIGKHAICVSDGFQFTRPHGARRDSLRKQGEVIMFQFTRPHGARLYIMERTELQGDPTSFPRSSVFLGYHSIFKERQICNIILCNNML